MVTAAFALGLVAAPRTTRFIALSDRARSQSLIWWMTKRRVRLLGLAGALAAGAAGAAARC